MGVISGAPAESSERCTCLYRRVRLSRVFLMKGDFLGSVELSLSLRYSWGRQTDSEWHPGGGERLACTSVWTYPAHILAACAWREGLRAHDGAVAHEGQGLAPAPPSLLGPHSHRLREGHLSVGLLVHLPSNNAINTPKGLVVRQTDVWLP